MGMAEHGMTARTRNDSLPLTALISSVYIYIHTHTRRIPVHCYGINQYNKIHAYAKPLIVILYFY